MYLLDTNIVSELRKARPNADVRAWIDQVDDNDLYLSAVTVGEIQAGIELTRAQDARKAAEIEAWLEQLASSFNILAMDAACFRQWARLLCRQSNKLNEDAMIAATAQVHGLTVVTRNTRDFARLHVPVLNPFK